MRPGLAPRSRRTPASARRYRAVQERPISSEGTCPIIGRSITCRLGAFHALAQAALPGELPEGVTPAQARCALAAAIRRLMEAPGPFDASGWLHPGVRGHRPPPGKYYISTGSLYLCPLPLGLPPSHLF